MEGGVGVHLEALMNLFFIFPCVLGCSFKDDNHWGFLGWPLREGVWGHHLLREHEEKRSFVSLLPKCFA